MITVTIPHKGEQAQLAALLVALQPQLHPDDDIYIVDTTKERSGLKIASMYGTTRCLIFVDSVNFDRDKAEEAGFESCIDNKQDGCLILSPNLMVSQTFITNLKKAIRIKDDQIDLLVPKVVSLPYPKMSSEFIWFATPTKEVVEGKLEPKIADCFYITSFGITSQLFYADPPARIGMFENETVYIFPYMSEK